MHATFWNSPAGWTLLVIGQILLVLLWLLLTCAWLGVWGDRKLFAGVQLRKGPNVVGPFGLLQPFADLGKFLLKEMMIPAGADKLVFLLAPLISITLALGAWAAMPLAPGWVVAPINVGILYLFAVSSMGVYGIIMGGWASNSKYPFLGALRSAAQMISYEVSIGFVIVTVILLAGSMNLATIVERQGGGFWNWNVLGGNGLHGLPAALVMIPMMVIFFISTLAETNRPPFDLPEAESELVAGYQVEYGSSPYMVFYLAETANITLMSALTATLFFGGWQSPIPISTAGWAPTLVSAWGFFWFFLKTVILYLGNSMVRAVVPRYRYDQLMRLGWKVFLPTSLAAVMLMGAVRVFWLNP